MTFRRTRGRPWHGPTGSHDDIRIEVKAVALPKAAMPAGLHLKRGRRRGTLKVAPPLASAAYRGRRVAVQHGVTRRGRVQDFRGTLGRQLRYLEREEAGENQQRALLLDRDGHEIDRAALLDRWERDDHYHRIIVPPLDGHALDMREYTIAVVHALEADLGTRLDVVFAVHEKPDAVNELNRHTHVLVRGVDDEGRTLELRRSYHQTMRHEAERIATERLGPVLEYEMDSYRARERVLEQESRLEFEKTQTPQEAEQRHEHSL